MSRSCSHRTPSLGAVAIAHRLAAALDVGELAEWAPVLIGVVDGASVVLPELDGAGGSPGGDDDPLRPLVGFTAPEAWSAVAVVAVGRSFPLHPFPLHSGPRGQPGRPIEGRRCGIVHCRSRSGDHATLTTFLDDGADLLAEGSGDDDACGGRLVDLSARVLGQATPAAPATTDRLWTLLWLDQLLARCATGAHPRTVADVVACHPAVTVLERAGPRLGPVTADSLVALGHILADARPWSALRAAAVEGLWSVDDLRPTDVAWFDDGSFARWVLGAFPEPGVLLDELRVLLPPGLHDVIEAHLAAERDTER